jgi:hypothetical protein
MIMNDTENYWVLFRHPTDKQTTLFETDEWPLAVTVLEGAVINPDAELIDYSYSLDGSIDDTLRRLDSVKIGYPVAA